MRNPEPLAALCEIADREKEPVTVCLPFPPSVNNLHINVPGRGRVAAPEYRAWKKLAGAQLDIQRPRKVHGRYRAVMTFERPDRRLRDVCNYEKAASDLLVSHGIVDDDHLSKRVILEWAEDETPRKDAQVTIIISEVM